MIHFLNLSLKVDLAKLKPRLDHSLSQILTAFKDPLTVTFISMNQFRVSNLVKNGASVLQFSRSKNRSQLLMSDNKLRIRWAAIGAAIAVTIGTGGLIGVNASQNDQSSTFVPVTPTRILDTRSSIKIGDLTDGSTTELQVTGSIKTSANETKVVVPTGSTAVSANVTVVAGETGPYDGYVTIYPCDVKRPDASSLNFVNAQTIPNAVSVPLSANGKVCIFVYGKAHILFDVVGYYSTTSISDLNASIIQLQDDLNNRLPKTIIEDSQGRQKEAVTFPDSATTYVLINDTYYPIDSKGFKETIGIGKRFYSQQDCLGDFYYYDPQITAILPSNAVLMSKRFETGVQSYELQEVSFDSHSPIPFGQSLSNAQQGNSCQNEVNTFGEISYSIVKVVWGAPAPVTEFTPPYTLVNEE
jgi:hypothetical protein